MNLANMWKCGDSIGRDEDGVEYRLFSEYEGDVSPEDSFDNEEDVAFARSGGEWAWCRVAMLAKHEEHDAIGADYLGGCSYASQADFLHPEGYAPDMKREARADLHRTLYARANPTPDEAARALLRKLEPDGT